MGDHRMDDHRRWYRITLEEPLILSQRNTTTGEHRTLDFIPGRVLLGLTARIYESLGDDAWTAFHSGEVRFVDAAPETNGGGRAISTPRCLQQIKRHKLTQAFNAAVPNSSAIDKGKQYTSLGAPYVEIEGPLLSTLAVEKTSTVKTAIDPGSGAARDEHLFSYQAIGRGQTFLARLDADEDVDKSILDALEDALVGSRRIGRSRSAEFGAVTIERIEDVGQRESIADVGATRLRVVLTSELALIDDDTGAPRLRPEASDFGLPVHWEIDLEHSFIRRRNFDRFNGYRKSFDLKRHVLQRGSVISFKSCGDRGLTAQELTNAKRRLRRGAGVDRHEGLGQFLLEPAWIGEETLSVESAQSDAQDDDVSMEAPDPALKAFVESRVDKITGEQREKLYRDAKKLARFCVTNRTDAPQKSQWSRLRQWAKAAPITDEAFRALAGDVQGRLTKGWGLTFEGEVLGYYLVKYGQNAGENGRHMLSELAHLVRANLVHQETKQDSEEASR